MDNIADSAGEVIFFPFVAAGSTGKPILLRRTTCQQLSLSSRSPVPLRHALSELWYEVVFRPLVCEELSRRSPIASLVNLGLVLFEIKRFGRGYYVDSVRLTDE